MRKNKLPKGWGSINVRSIISTLEIGNRPKGGAGKLLEGIPSISAEHFAYGGIFKFENLKFIPRDFYESLRKGKLEIEDILIVKDGATTGKSAYIDESFPYEEAAVNEHTFILRTNSTYQSKLLFYFTLTSEFNNFILTTKGGSTIGGIKVGFVDKLEIPMPPLPEQKRIVAKLDSLFAHLEETKARLEKVPQLLKDFRQAVLTQAVTGKLTGDWRGNRELVNEFSKLSTSDHRGFDHKLPQVWEVKSFCDIAEIKSNLVDPNLYLEYPLIAPNNIEKETGRLIEKPLVCDISPKSGKHCFEANTIVYSKIRPYLSKLIIADFDGLCSADMYPIRTKLNLKYLFFYMLSSEFVGFASSAGERSVLPKINQKGMNIIPVPTPPLEEQIEIVRIVEKLFSKTKVIQAKYTTLKDKIDNLPQTILAKAFRGELVEQLDSDGDAKELLEEINKLKSQKKKGK